MKIINIVYIENCLKLNSVDLLKFSIDSDFVIIYKIINTIRLSTFFLFIVNNQLYIQSNHRIAIHNPANSKLVLSNSINPGDKTINWHSIMNFIVLLLGSLYYFL